MLYNARSKVITSFDDYLTIVSVAKYETIHGEGNKILTSCTEKKQVVNLKIYEMKLLILLDYNVIFQIK